MGGRMVQYSAWGRGGAVSGVKWDVGRMGGQDGAVQCMGKGMCRVAVGMWYVWEGRKVHCSAWGTEHVGWEGGVGRMGGQCSAVHGEGNV